MKVVYTAPNRAHHYGYARALHQAGLLKAFVAGFPRYSPRAPLPEIGSTLKRVDLAQTLFLASQKMRLPRWVSGELAHWAKIQMDLGSRSPLKGADVFLFYNGCGLSSARWFRKNDGITIVEAVNSHVVVQEHLLAEEHQMLGLSWRPFHRREMRRRVVEVEEADYVLVPSTFVARSFRAQGIAAERLLRVPYPLQSIAGATGREPGASNGDKFRVLYVGSISVRKGLRYLIEAFRQLKHPRKELWVVGPMATPSGLEDLVIPDEVTFFGSLKGDALQKKYQQATAFCLPSIEEGLALVLSEAISYGLPVIATENSGIEDLLPDGQGGMVVPIRDAGAIKDNLQRLADDPDFLKTKQAEAKAIAEYLVGQANPAPTLVETLLKTFQKHRTGKARDQTSEV